MRMMLNVAAIILFLVSLTSCGKVIEDGEFHGFKIGMSRGDALNVLKFHSNIKHIQPTVDPRLIIESSEKLDEARINQVLDSNPILIEGTKDDAKIVITFKESLIDDELSSGLFVNPWGIKEGMSKDEVKEKIIQGVENKTIARVYSYIADGKWREVESISLREFTKHDNWGFHGISKYSYTRLHFENGMLKRITHNWTPVELP